MLFLNARDMMILNVKLILNNKMMSDFAWFLMVPISAIIGHYATEIVRAIYGRERKEDDNKEE